MQIDYVKISYEEDVHIYHTSFTKKWNEIGMEQLVSGKCIENDCFPRTLKFEMLCLNRTLEESDWLPQYRGASTV
jgi:hypothetical protein